MQLAIVVPHRFYCVLLIHTGNHSAFDNPESMFPLSDSQSIVDVALRQLQQLSPGSFGDVPLGFNYRNWKYGPQALYKRLAHDYDFAQAPASIGGGLLTFIPLYSISLPADHIPNRPGIFQNCPTDIGKIPWFNQSQLLFKFHRPAALKNHGYKFRTKIMVFSVSANGEQASKQAQQVVVVQGSVRGKPLNDMP